jgi:tungstate transport system ATP-binding protein
MNLKLKADSISKSYNGKKVLNDCSVFFDKGGVIVLTGPNGCGKSTFLRICALLEKPDSGRVSYLSENMAVKDDMVLRRRITLVLPGVGVFNTSVYRNVAYGLKVRGLGRGVIEQKVSKALSLAGLADKRDHNALTLSSGETQRLGIARAMVIEPDILFLDEPTAFMDQENTEIIEDIIFTMKKKKETTVIMTTHYLKQAERLADRLMIFQEGRLIDL